MAEVKPTLYHLSLTADDCQYLLAILNSAVVEGGVFRVLDAFDRAGLNYDNCTKEAFAVLDINGKKVEVDVELKVRNKK